MTHYLAEAEDQYRPGRAGYDRFDLMVASAELPCGVAWLASCLFELGVPLWKPWGIDDSEHWKFLGARRWRYEFPGSGWSRLIPGFVDGRELRLRKRPVPQFTHAWPGQLPLAGKLIVFVRDPRDSLFSDWQRRRRIWPDSRQELRQFLDEPSPGLGIPPRVWLSYYMGAWNAASRLRPSLIVRFEDAKGNPAATLRTTLKFMGIKASAREQRRAVEASTHQRVAEADARLVADRVVPTRLLGPGIPFAHRGRTPDHCVVLDQRLARAAQSVGYDDAIAGFEDPSPPQIQLDSLRDTLRANCADPELLDHCLSAAMGNL